MTRLVAAMGVMLLFAAGVAGAEQTWVGEISDSACGSKHESGAENVPTPPSKECTLDCVRGGSKFVLVSDGKVFQIGNQGHAEIRGHAGARVKITGELKAGAIDVAKVEAAR